MSKEAPYLSVDFDVLEKVGPAGAACGLSEERVFLALGKLWLYCWRNKTEHVTTTHLLGFFYGVNACEALLTFGFIAATPNGWRVKGADRWLFVQKARSENGKAQSGNLKRGTQPGPGKLPAPPIESPACPRDPPGTPSGSAPALTASSVKRPTSNDQHKEEAASPEIWMPEAFDPPDKFADSGAFEEWFQFKRGQQGFIREKRAGPVERGRWWTAVHVALKGDPVPLETAAIRFAKDPHWEAATPPMPFRAFMSEWPKYIPQRKVA